MEENKNFKPQISRVIISILASLYFLYYFFTLADWHFLDAANLIIHEAGHVVFMFFGEFLHILGGSLFQILLPVLFVYYFYKREDYFSASLLLFWVGQNLLNVSVYASDAIAMQLPLLGGDSVGHDWNALLSITGLLSHTALVGSTIYFCGAVCILLAICFSFYFSLYSRDVSEKSF